jgi:hypothetical protein
MKPKRDEKKNQNKLQLRKLTLRNLTGLNHEEQKGIKAGVKIPRGTTIDPPLCH